MISDPVNSANSRHAIGCIPVRNDDVIHTENPIRRQPLDLTFLPLLSSTFLCSSLHPLHYALRKALQHRPLQGCLPIPKAHEDFHSQDLMLLRVFSLPDALPAL